MAANVKERAQRAIGTAHNNDGLTSHSRSNKISRILQLVCAGDELPGFAEDNQPLQFCNPRIDVPRSGDRERLGQRRAVVVAGQDLLNGCLHLFALAENSETEVKVSREPAT